MERPKRASAAAAASKLSAMADAESDNGSDHENAGSAPRSGVKAAGGASGGGRGAKAAGRKGQRASDASRSGKSTAASAGSTGEAKVPGKSWAPPPSRSGAFGNTDPSLPRLREDLSVEELRTLQHVVLGIKNALIDRLTEVEVEEAAAAFGGSFDDNEPLD